MGENSTSELTELKGKGSSGTIKKLEFPIQISNELLTRIETSVKENSDGTPTYLTEEKSLADRFTELMQDLGNVQLKTYSRNSRYEVRFPKFLNQLLSNLEHQPNLPALIDEKGEIKQNKITVEDQSIDIMEFDEKLYSREKKFEIALQRENSDTIAELMAEESSKVRNLIF
jgi:hypothetical protein